MPALTVLRPGMLTTVQDLGRWGYQSSGVPVAGPMDLYSHRRANRLVGNDDSVPALEVTLIGPELQADGDVVCAVAGARFSVSVGGVLVPPDAPFVAPAGQRIRFGPRAAGARATLAVRGGFALPETFGSRATSLVSGMGPFGGRALATGDEADPEDLIIRADHAMYAAKSDATAAQEQAPAPGQRISFARTALAAARSSDPGCVSKNVGFRV